MNARIGGIKWSKQIKALGIWFGIDKSKCENFYYIKNSFEKTPKSFAEIRKQIIWGNSYIRLNNKTLVFKTWIKSGILYI